MTWVKTYSGGKPNYTEPCERCGEVNPAEIHTCTPKQREMNKDEYIKFLEAACRDIYEVWAGSEGIPMPETAPEGYLLFLVEQMRDIAKRALAQPEQIISQEWQPANPDAKLRHYSLVLRDLDKTIEGWCEQPEFYLDGKRIDVTQQKPVAWRKKWEGDEDYTYYWMCRYKDSEPLYTAPPQREWQGLTEEEIIRLRHLYDPTAHWSLDMFARAIEAKIREKNA